VENLGNGVLVTYAIISPILLIAYVLDGIYAIQSLFLEPVSRNPVASLSENGNEKTNRATNSKDTINPQ
jgi:hypothetical protein